MTKQYKAPRGTLDILPQDQPYWDRVYQAAARVCALFGYQRIETPVFEVNFFGAVNCVQAAVPHMKQRRRGAIAIVSSVVGRLAPPYSGAYAATKGALNALTDSLRLELEPYGVTVTAVYPGYTRTRFGENLLRELEIARPSRLVRGGGPEAVARKIVRAVREGKREAYVTRGDAAAVMIKNVSPRLIDWGMRRLWLSGRRPE